MTIEVLATTKSLDVRCIAVNIDFIRLFLVLNL